MINTKELRIGNWIDTPRGVRQVAVIEDDIISCYCDGAFRAVFFPKAQQDLHPITITNEWLLKLGFSLNPNHDWHRDYQWDEYKWHCIELADFNGDGFIINNTEHWGELIIKYVHQLQNIVFSLTGQELPTPASSSSTDQRSGH